MCIRDRSRVGSEAGGSAYSKRRSLGVKDIDGQMDRMNKQNFALKLELDHRREQQLKLQEQLEAMREQVERAERLEEEHAELLKINTQLVEELEKRDKAVEEAMDIICDLEDKVVDLEERRSHTRPSTANADSGYAGTETQEQVPPSSPPEISRPPKTPRMPQQAPSAASAASQKLHSMVNDQTPARLRREPSILSQKKPSTHALRSVYMENAQNLHSVKSFNSLLSKRDSRVEEDRFPEDVLNSPRLSVLSKSSFPSLYSPKKEASPERYAWEAPEEEEVPGSVPSHFRQDSINRVSRWISDGDAVDETPSKPNRVASPLSGRTERGMPPPALPRSTAASNFQSLNDALSTVSLSGAHQSGELLQPVAYSKPRSANSDKQRTPQLQQPRPLSIGGPIFGEPLLPPTPDSASTRMLRASRSSIANERSLLDTTPAPVNGFDALALAPRTAPASRTAPTQTRSSIELGDTYHSSSKYRDGALGNQQDDSSSEDDDYDARSETIKDLSLDYDGFPDGNSILMGTPSRFLRHGKGPVADQLFYDGHDVSPPETARSPPRRRQSSSEATVSPRKPSLGRAETSPTFLGTIGRLMTSGSKSAADTVTSPRSYNSGSSSNRTIMNAEVLSSGSLSPDLNRTQSRISASTARTLSQRTQQLFRRMSNSQSERSEPRSPIEKSPLPTLTSTPSSAYMNMVPKGPRRPSTSEAKLTPNGTAARRADSGGEGRRPSLQARTKTEPAKAESSADRINPFKRSGSVKQTADARVSPNVRPPSSGNSAEKDGRGGITRRRGSIREAVGGSRRPWR